MNRLGYPYTTVHLQPIDNLLLHNRGRLFHFERGIVELIHQRYQGEGDPRGGRWWLLVTDITKHPKDAPARAFPAPEPIEDYERLTDTFATPELIGRVSAMNDGWVA